MFRLLKSNDPKNNVLQGWLGPTIGTRGSINSKYQPSTFVRPQCAFT